MQLPEPARKELYSIAYVAAVAAAAQSELFMPKMDYSSVDGLLMSTIGAQPIIAIQLKATATDCIEGEEVVFDMPIKNYNDLRRPRAAPGMLVVLHLPKDESQWMTHDLGSLLLRNDAYYFNLANLPDSGNVASVRIRIPREQRLTKDSLATLFDHVSAHRSLP